MIYDLDDNVLGNDFTPKFDSLMDDWWSLITPIVTQVNPVELSNANTYFNTTESSYKYVIKHTPSL